MEGLSSCENGGAIQPQLQFAINLLCTTHIRQVSVMSGVNQYQLHLAIQKLSTCVITTPYITPYDIYVGLPSVFNCVFKVYHNKLNICHLL